MSADLPDEYDSPRAWVLDTRNPPGILPTPDLPYPYAARRASGLRLVTSSDDLVEDAPESPSSRRTSNQSNLARQETERSELGRSEGEGSQSGSEREHRKDSKVEVENEGAKDERSARLEPPATRTNESEDVQGEASDSDDTVRPARPTREDDEAEDPDSEGTASLDDLSNEAYALHRTGTNLEPGWLNDPPQSPFAPHVGTYDDEQSDFPRFDGDWSGPSGPPIGEASLTKENLTTFLNDLKLEGNKQESRSSTRLGPSGEAPQPEDWFSRPLSLQGESNKEFLQSFGRKIAQEHASKQPVNKDEGEAPRSAPTQRAPEPGKWFGRRNSQKGSRRSGKPTDLPTKPKPVLRRSRREPETLQEAQRLSSDEHRRTSVEFDEQASGSNSGPRQKSRRPEEAKRCSEVLQSALGRSGKAVRQTGAYHREQEHKRRSSNEEAQQTAVENALSLQAELSEDSEAIEEDEGEDVDKPALIGISRDLDSERQRFRGRRHRRPKSPSYPMESPSESSSERDQASSQSGSHSQSDPAFDKFPSMEEVWRHVGLGPSVDRLMQSGQWSQMESHWNILQDYDVMWEFKSYWDRMLEGGDVQFEEFLEIWKRALSTLEGRIFGRNDSATQTVRDPAELDLELDQNPDYRNADPYDDGESVYLDRDFRSALIHKPSIDPTTNDWTRQFFELHVFYWQKLVNEFSSSAAAPTPPAEVFDEDDPKGKKPLNRDLRGGYDAPPLIRTIRYKRRRRPFILRKRYPKVRGPRSSAMNNYFNSGDMANSVPRQAPSPGAQHQTNGIGGNSMANLNNSVLPAGQQADMNHLWSVVEQLSQLLAENRVQTAGIVNNVQQIQSRAAANGTSPTVASLNDDLHQANAAAQLPNSSSANHNNVNASTAAQQLSQLTREHTQLQHSHASLAHSHAALLALLTQHETLLDTHLLPQLRRYAHAHAAALTALHAHYQRLLEDERGANLGLRLEHQKWQEGLGRVSRWARLALRETAEGEGRRKERERLGKLKEENRVLRGLVGWEERGEESEEEGEGEGRESVGAAE
ncbi:MAG: hypothetical protein M1822_000432 [Bathelium mastoideum]|nr:MAG: hypothetical protein M1822_000432 [Bathelium mastoideum]